MNLVATPEAYGFGKSCTWHGPLTFAKLVTDRVTEKQIEIGAYVCPSCGGALAITVAADFWAGVAVADRQRPGYENLMTWSEGACYPDFETMENAWRQAMEGRE